MPVEFEVSEAAKCFEMKNVDSQLIREAALEYRFNLKRRIFFTLK